MNKNEQQLKARAEYIKTEVNKSKEVLKTINDIANRLFISPSTVMKDLKK